MKKKYTKPSIVKVELKHEQAVLGTCSSGATTMWDNSAMGYCKVHGHGGCKQWDRSGGTDSGASS